MSPVFVYLPDEDGYCCVSVNGEILGRAFNGDDIFALLELVGVEDSDEAGVIWLQQIE
ncbi:hypothetical protein ACFYPT_40200 [Streptomyces sp. NPDC005529]|uniref:hypothetical protein n=1 Tax=unclassified Streptomyces TaxID=2593676 RepID=UPI00339FFDB6